MMAGMPEARDTAHYAAPEVRNLFEKGSVQIEDEILTFIKESEFIDVGKTAEHFKLSRESTLYFLSSLARNEKIQFSA